MSKVVATGLTPDIISINKYGRNLDIDKKGSVTAVDIGRDVWDLGIAGATKWVPPTAARIHQIASSSNEDGAGTNTGALTLRVFGLDSDFLEIQEDIVLNGTTDVPTVNAYTMIYRMIVLTAGSTEKNIGDIDATADTDSTVTARVTAAFGQTQMSIYQIPADKTGFLYSFFGSLNKLGGASIFADLILMYKPFGSIWTVQDSLFVATDGGSYAQHHFSYPTQLAAKTYIKVVGDPSADGQDISAGFSLTLVE